MSVTDSSIGSQTKAVALAASMLRRNALTLVLLVTVSACASTSPATGQPSIAIRSDARLIAPDEAQGLPPQELADILLAQPRPAAVEATVGPEGMDAPTPPGPASIRIKLYFEPALSLHRGFCERLSATVMMSRADRLENGLLAPAKPQSVTTETSYRWIGLNTPSSACPAPRHSFFNPDADELTVALETVRILVAARDHARSRRPLAFELTVDDQMARTLNDYRQRSMSKSPPMQVISDARTALGSLNLGTISFAGPSRRAASDILTASDLVDARGRQLDGRIIFLGGEWTAGLVLDDGRLTRVRLVRAIPPPF